MYIAGSLDYHSFSHHLRSQMESQGSSNLLTLIKEVFSINEVENKALWKILADLKNLLIDILRSNQSVHVES